MQYITERKEEDGITFSGISYVGDGQNDVCPSLKLGPNDRVFARSGYPLHKRLAINHEFKAKLHPFTDGHDIWKVLNSRNVNNNYDGYNTDVDK
jgi:hypothetical protein